MKACRVFLLLIGLMGAGTAWAQAGGDAPAFVDSAQECSALGGAWLGKRGTWQAACQVPWARTECLGLGGAWTPMRAAPGGGICMAQVSLQATARQCTASGGSWGPPGSSMPYCEPGTVTAKAPIRAASDANKICDSQSDCIYGCIYRGPPKPTGAGVTGQCRPTSQIEGCYSMVEKGRLAGNICMK
jgi:hypothetical protein